MLRTRLLPLLLPAGLAVVSGAEAGVLFLFDGPSGLSAEAEFSLVDPVTVEIRLQNSSTGAPEWFGASDQILTTISFDLGAPGFSATDPSIVGGTVLIGPSSETIDFDTGSYGPGSDVSGEWGFGNDDGSGGLQNLVTATAAQATPFGGPNLDGPGSIDGPQGGVVADPLVLPLGGQGAIQDEVIIRITLSRPIEDLGFLTEHGTRVEFGSDAAFADGYIPPVPTLETSWGGVKASFR